MFIINMRARKRDQSSWCFVKMASSQRYSFDGKTVRSQTKYVVMNVWEYFEREAQKSRYSVNCTAKVAKATGERYKGFLSLYL